MSTADTSSASTRASSCDTDLGNAERLVHAFGHELRYVPTWGRWLVWDGARWASDDLNGAMTRAREVPSLVALEAFGRTDQDVRRKLRVWSAKSESAPRIKAALELAEADERIVVRPTQLDAAVDLLNCPNGTVDLKTGRLRPHDRSELHTKVTSVPLRLGDTPGWQGFLARILPDATMRRYVQLALGYSLTGQVSEQCFFLPHGGGSNGKTTLLNVVRRVLGDYGSEAAPDLLMAKHHASHPTELAELKGTRFVTAVEIREGRKLDEALTKRLTGGDPVRARFMRQDFFEFQPSHTLWLAVNHLPRISDASEAMWRRVRRIPFSVTIPDGEKVKDFDTKLVESEGAAILAWLVEGAVEWYRAGLVTPIDVQLATEAYRQSEDHLTGFFEACCRFGPGWVAFADLRSAYKEWCAGNGVDDDDRLSSHGLTNRLASAGCKPHRRKVGGKQVRGWAGISLLDGVHEATLEGG